MPNPKDQLYKEKFMAFAIRMVKLKNYLNNEKHEYNIADQIQRSGTAIGANHREATFAESDSRTLSKNGNGAKGSNRNEALGVGVKRMTNINSKE